MAYLEVKMGDKVRITEYNGLSVNEVRTVMMRQLGGFYTDTGINSDVPSWVDMGHDSFEVIEKRKVPKR